LKNKLSVPEIFLKHPFTSFPATSNVEELDKDKISATVNCKYTTSDISIIEMSIFLRQNYHFWQLLHS